MRTGVLAALIAALLATAVMSGRSIAQSGDPGAPPGPPDTETPVPTTAPPGPPDTERPPDITAPPSTTTPTTTPGPPPTPPPPPPPSPSPPGPSPTPLPSQAPTPGGAPPAGPAPAVPGAQPQPLGSGTPRAPRGAAPDAPPLVTAPIPFAASPEEIAARAERAEALLQATVAADLVQGDIDPAPTGTPTQQQIDAVAASRLERTLEYRTARDDLARAVASRGFVPPERLLLEWDATPNETLSVAYFALAQLGKPSEPGQVGPDRYDASSLAMVAWTRAGVHMPRWSADQLVQFPQVNWPHARPGDVGAYGVGGGSESAIYLGAGMVVGAPSSGGAVDTASAWPELAGFARPSGIVEPEHSPANPVIRPAPPSVSIVGAQPEPGKDPLAFLARTALAGFDNNVQAEVRRRTADAALRSPALLGSSITRDEARRGVPARLVPVYQSAARTCPAPPGWWGVLAAIGAHESGHGTANQSSVGADGTSTRAIYGPRLDGSGAGGNTSPIFDTDTGRWDSDPEYDRAVGPMQFLPSTWARHGVRAPERGPGPSDPQNILDAIYSAAKYLCAAQGGAITDERAAVRTYNASDAYVDAVLRAAGEFAARAPTLAPALRPIPSEEQRQTAAKANADVRRTRTALGEAVSDLAAGIGDRFGVDPVPLVEQWRWAPPAALRPTLWALTQLGHEANGGDSGFTAAAWGRGGVTLPATPNEQYAAGQPLDPSQLRPGDLVAFGPEGSDHVGFYVGDGVMVHVSDAGQPVQLDGYDPADIALFSRPGQPSPLAGIAGFLRRPVGGPITSGFGARTHPIHGDVRFHKGVDISARSGDPIHASADGIVMEAGWQGGYGNAVLIDHGNGLATFYAHNSRNAATIGQRVRTGEVIAQVGSTGASTGPHLHFEVRVNGQAVDPAPYLGAF